MNTAELQKIITAEVAKSFKQKSSSEAQLSGVLINIQKESESFDNARENMVEAFQRVRIPTK